MKIILSLTFAIATILQTTAALAQPCGASGSVKERIADCNHTLIDLKGGRWFLVSRACNTANCGDNIYRVWQDEETKTIWGGTILTSQLNAQKICNSATTTWVFNNLPGNWKVASFADYLFLQERHITYQHQTQFVIDSPYYYWTDQLEKMAVITDFDRPMTIVANGPENPMNVMCKIAN